MFVVGLFEKSSAIYSGRLLIIFVASFIIFTLAIPHEFLNVYDSRFGLFAQNMLAHGPSFFGWSYGSPYPDYTSGSTLFSAVSAWLFGKVSMFTVTLPNAIVSSLILVLIYKIAAKTSEDWAYFAVIFALLTSTFFTGAYSLGPDQYIVLLAATLFYLLYEAALEKRPINYLFVSMLLGLGFVFRGPIGLIILSGVGVSFNLVWRDYKEFCKFSIIAGALLVLLTSALLAAAYHEGGKSFYQSVVNMEIGSRFTNLSGYHSVGKYLKNVFVREAIACPLALLVGIYILITSRSKLLLALFAWFAIIVIGIGIPHGREARYVIPISPAIALLAAYPFSRLSSESKFIKFYRVAVATFMRFLPFLCLGVVLVMMIISFTHSMPRHLNFYLVISLLALLSGWSFYNIRQQHLSLLLGLLTYIVMMLFVIGPITISGKSLVAFSEKIESTGKPIYFYNVGPDSTDLQVLVSMKKPLSVKPHFIQNMKQLAQVQDGVIIMKAAKYKLLSSAMQHQLKIIEPASRQGKPSLIAVIKQSTTPINTNSL